MQLLTLFTIAGVFLLSAVIGQAQTHTFDEIIYSFRDASVPPPYHRSYVIRINAKEAQVEVSDYEEILHQKTTPISAKQWADLQNKAKQLEQPGQKFQEGATGTSSQTIVLKNQQVENYKLLWDSLSEVSAPTEAFVEAIKATIPKLSGLLR
ncbi:hypothetical protein [Eisenibacter elegans]|uniref:hypothetical protein n=1 Tax=Eisenibacter elegans TaxID=997 RepID=UPI00040F420F|nr:hypothetical protein [Eisenibacter elegans]